MSKRHTANRRRSYGRRQHELHERLERRHDRRAERGWRYAAGVGVHALADDASHHDAHDGDID